MATQTQTKEQNVQGEFSTAEVTHLVKAMQMEGMCYLQNHLLMQLCGEERVLREYHDAVTRTNVDRLRGLLRDSGLPVPFAMPLEDRENEIKAKLQGTNVAGVLTEGEALATVLMDAEQMAVFYTVSYNLATHTRVQDVFRKNLQTVMDEKPRLEEAFRKTKEHVEPPVAKTVQLVGAMTRGTGAGSR